MLYLLVTTEAFCFINYFGADNLVSDIHPSIINWLHGLKLQYLFLHVSVQFTYEDDDIYHLLLWLNLIIANNPNSTFVLLPFPFSGIFFKILLSYISTPLCMWELVSCSWNFILCTFYFYDHVKLLNQKDFFCRMWFLIIVYTSMLVHEVSIVTKLSLWMRCTY